MVKQVISKISNIDTIRERVLNSSISFDEDIQYYTDINTNLIRSIKTISMILKKQSNDNHALSRLHQLKENAGLERAYIYSSLLSDVYSSDQADKIKEFQDEQNNNQEQFFLNASILSTLIYTDILKKENEKQLLILRKKFFNNTLNNSDAFEWFKVSTFRIDMLEEISSKILNQYIQNANKEHSKALYSLYITALLWMLSLLSLALLTYILRRLIKMKSNIHKSYVYPHIHLILMKL